MNNTCTFNYNDVETINEKKNYKKRKICDMATKPTIFEQTPVEQKKN